MNEAWVDGFIAGYRGRPCPKDASEDFQDGYSRGYETSETESANQIWWQEQKQQVLRLARDI